MAILIPPDAEPREVLPAAGGPAFALSELQGMVNGYLEALRLSDNQWLVINEEGKLRGLPFNSIATGLAVAHRRIATDDYIVGPAIVCTTDEMGGTDAGEE